MKKIIIVFIVLLICGCSDKEEVVEGEKVSSTGELICVYKERRVNENTLYTSYYLFKFTNQGILTSAVNNEEIMFEDTSDDIKENYKQALEETIKEYDNIEGISVTKKIEEDVVSFNLDMDISKMDDETKETYYLDLDRINTYKTFTNMGYTCE